MNRPRTVSVHFWRRTARREERRLEELLDKVRVRGQVTALERRQATVELERSGVPAWAQHVRVERYNGAGRGRWQVQATG